MPTLAGALGCYGRSVSLHGSGRRRGWVEPSPETTIGRIQPVTTGRPTGAGGLALSSERRVSTTRALLYCGDVIDM